MKESTILKVIIDTNILISFLIGKRLENLPRLLKSKALVWVTSDEQVSELLEVLTRQKFKKYFSNEQIAEFIRLIEDFSINVQFKTNINFCRDPKDNYLLSMAVDSMADYLVSGDKDLLELKKFQTQKLLDIACLKV